MNIEDIVTALADQLADDQVVVITNTGWRIGTMPEGRLAVTPGSAQFQQMFGVVHDEGFNF